MEAPSLTTVKDVAEEEKKAVTEPPKELDDLITAENAEVEKRIEEGWGGEPSINMTFQDKWIGWDTDFFIFSFQSQAFRVTRWSWTEEAAAWSSFERGAEKAEERGKSGDKWCRRSAGGWRGAPRPDGTGCRPRHRAWTRILSSYGRGGGRTGELLRWKHCVLTITDSIKSRLEIGDRRATQINFAPPLPLLSCQGQGSMLKVQQTLLNLLNRVCPRDSFNCLLLRKLDVHCEYAGWRAVPTIC